jgi:hypothetical protein
MKKIRLLTATAILAIAAITNGFSQSNLGEACGCPVPVSDRPEVNFSTLVTTVGGIDLLTKSTVLTCTNTYILDRKVYVPEGLTLTIMPGTVIKGAPNLDAANACAIVVARGGKIIADGTESCPIVMTTTEDINFDGTYPVCNKGKWGGLVILGKGKNNVTPNNGLYVSPGVAYVEGYPAANPYNVHGAAPGTENDDDNSGILRYVSVRHAGATITTANELNGITLGSVGRGTTIDHVEIVANDDDGIEFFGGTVNVKYVAMWWGNDDMFDWDLGWRGNAQFLFGIVSPDRVALPGADNAFESDGDDKNMTSRRTA